MRFWRAVIIMIATILGLGILGLPYVFERAGYGLGLVELILVGVSMTCIYLMYAEMTLDVPGKHRYAGYMRRLLGARAGMAAGGLFVAAMFGGLLPPLIVTGPFLESLLGMDRLTGLLLMWALSAMLIFGGIRFVVRAELLIILSLTFAYLLLMIFSTASFDAANIQWSGDPRAAFLPIGVILFAFGGIGAIPEMHDLLGRERQQIGRAIIVAMAFLFVLYALFSLTVVGTLGAIVTQNPLPLLAQLLPKFIGTLSLLVGTVSAFSIFTVIGSELMETIHVDYGWHKLSAWLVVIFVPLMIYLAGARELTAVMGFFGSTFGAAVGLFVIAAYAKTKAPRLLPLWVRYPVGAVFLLGVLIEIGYTLGVL